jgi:NTP pyrophosphatase (non-canonical NTP hydrolase)
MEFDNYQTRAAETAIYPTGSLTYLALGLNGEAGEVAEIIKRMVRKQEDLSPEQRDRLVLELGDCLWYIANMARELEVSLETVAKRNIEKLFSRKARSALEGSGDYR